jgi:hypothetical protein
MLQIVTILKAMIEVALFAFLGQGILFILAGPRRDKNFVFVILKTITMPLTKLIRLVSPRIVLDRHIPLATFILSLVLWAGLTIAKVTLILQTR